MKTLSRAGRGALLALLCFSGFLSGCALLGFFSPAIPLMPQVSDKLEHYQHSDGQYSTLFFGSSKIFHGFIPENFDRELGREKRGEQSFNIATDGMAFPETAYFCEQVLAGPHPNLQYVIVELTPVRVRVPPGFRGTQRMLYWHDWKRTWLMIRTILDDWPSLAALRTPVSILANQTPLDTLLEHAALGLQRFCGSGVGAGWLERQLVSEPALLGPQPKERDRWSGRGYSPIWLKMPAAGLPAWNKFMAEFKLPNTERPCLSGEEAFLDLDRRVTAAGAQLILVVFPNFVPNRRFFIEKRNRLLPPIWSFDRPDDFRALYDPANRENETHINHDGAQLFTEAMAKQFGEYLRTNARN